ncbi:MULTISPECIES: LysR family transcriptional regulator [unclassified Shinella]|uniref:LysR family transcriptional regulator n=1 Tax=unclassified Shinella TaxID=2643062 RepID=UPI00225CC84E|nr:MULTISPECIES: LysR family transcriptional regulator [unclassified Shinella]CAI0334131.1 HTH-type transcriptional regulator DgdR [Rhizobiaceae bacterium]CAK7261783.1 HTH-type transcriptional regulator DgdR [Shinella sp. WSC3-e]MDC7259698.1 LysR family transcriptional regulator [Shinella sp. YE25]MDC7266878.1 LysR family transcriptional regulator [Shinella sp. HY16]MDC7273775.1 LysR family transcriptional regulator [Shinella sp. YZ44]
MKPNLDIALLRSFVVVSRVGSIRAAAGRIGRTQSAISLQIKRLEEIVGERLFHRMGSGVALTGAGERFFPGAERILAVHDETIEAIRSESVTGSLVFGCPEDYLTAFFPDLLRRYGAKYPGVEIEIVCAPTVELYPLLQSRRIDLALVSVSASAPPRDIIRYEPLVWIASEKAPALLSEPVLPLALSGSETIDHQEARRAMDALGINYRVTHASNGLAGVLTIARSGLAISVVTRAAVPPDLAIVAKGLPHLPEIGVSLIYASAKPTRAVQSFGAFILSSLKSA